jgi:hypothetical protein
LTLRISPLVFFTFLSLRKKYLPRGVGSSRFSTAQAEEGRESVGESEPELRLGADVVGRPHLHAVHRRLGLLFRGRLASDDVVLPVARQVVPGLLLPTPSHHSAAALLAELDPSGAVALLSEAHEAQPSAFTWRLLVPPPC